MVDINVLLNNAKELVENRINEVFPEIDTAYKSVCDAAKNRKIRWKLYII